MAAGAINKEAGIMACKICKDLGWVCENHPDKTWDELNGGCECGAGMPCKCNSLHRSRRKFKSESDKRIEELEGKLEVAKTAFKYISDRSWASENKESAFKWVNEFVEVSNETLEKLK
jgi:hypothetical protein